MVFGVIDFLQKTNEWIRFTTMRPIIVRFLEEIDHPPKNLFEIIWPLSGSMYMKKESENEREKKKKSMDSSVKKSIHKLCTTVIRR